MNRVYARSKYLIFTLLLVLISTTGCKKSDDTASSGGSGEFSG